MISVILPTYCPTTDVAFKLLRCIDSLRITPAGVPIDEFIVIEQGDSVLTGVELHPISENPIWVQLPKPVGFARAVNLGVEIARSEWLLIINNDIVALQDNWIKKLIDCYTSIPNMGILTPIDSAEFRGNYLARDWGWWSCVLIHRDVWKTVGPLNDVNLPYRFHDQDWNLRAKLFNYEVCRLRSVPVLHDEASTYRHMAVEESPEINYMLKVHGVKHFNDRYRPVLDWKAYA